MFNIQMCKITQNNVELHVRFVKVIERNKVEAKCFIRKLPLVVITKLFYKSIEVSGVTNNINTNTHCCMFKKHLEVQILRIKR